MVADISVIRKDAPRLIREVDSALAMVAGNGAGFLGAIKELPI